jgi:hypothetical protein
MRRNCFHDFFQPRQRLAGVEVIADDSVEGLDYPVPLWPEKWTREILFSPVHMRHTADETAAMNRLVTSDEDPVAPTVVLNQWVEPPPPRDQMRILFEDLRAAEPIRARAQQFWDERIGSALAVAIHIRHGNGENLGSRTPYWLGPVALVRQLLINARADINRQGLSGRFSDNMPASLVGTPGQAAAERRTCRNIASEFHALCRTAGLEGAVPLLFCDSKQIVETMREILPALVVPPTRLLEKGEGPLHQLTANTINFTAQGGIRSGNIPEEITREMFVDLELMQRCDGLVYMDSGFSLISRSKLDESRVSRLRPSFVNRAISKIMSRLT